MRQYCLPNYHQVRTHPVQAQLCDLAMATKPPSLALLEKKAGALADAAIFKLPK
jgi:hypothetical protein